MSLIKITHPGSLPRSHKVVDSRVGGETGDNFATAEPSAMAEGAGQIT